MSLDAAQEPLPDEARKYVSVVARRLRSLPRKDRREVIDSVASRIRDAVGDGADIHEIVASLADPADTARRAESEYEARTGLAARPPFLTPARAAQIVSLSLAIAATVAVLVLPLTVEEVVTSNGEHIVRTPTLLETYSTRVLVAVLVPVAITAVPLLVSGWAWKPSSIGATVLLGAFAVLASASVGWFYIPAFLAAIIALVLPRRTHLRT